ncbi:MAG: hypothetical protein V3V13_04205 [Paracoccaceae bacterium]
METVAAFTNDDIKDVLKNILASRQFSASPQVSLVLQYVVEETLAGRAARIKAYSIAIDVLKKTDDFDPASNPLVRVLAGRLRISLAAYYVSPSGLKQPIVITIPKGSYVPVFAKASSPQPPTSDTQSVQSENTVLFSRTIAVEKFEVFASETTSETATARSELVSAGLQIELIDKLSRFKDFTVIEITPDMSGTKIHELDKSSGQYSLSGMIRLSAARIIITPVLRRLADQGIIWSKTYDEVFETTDTLFDIQSSIASDVAATLGQPYGTIITRIASTRPNLEGMGMDHYFALVDFYQYSNNKIHKNFDRILAGLEKVTDEVPGFSSAWAALSWMYTDMKFHVDKKVNINKLSAKALAAAQKAVSTDPENAMAYQYLAIAKFNNKDAEGFKAAARTALRLNPNDAEVLADMGSHFIQLENSDEGKAMVERAMQLSPGHPPWYHLSIAMYYYMRNNSDQAIYHARQYAQVGSLSSYILLAASLVQDDQLEEAEEIFQLMISKRPIFTKNYQKILDGWPLPDGMREMLLADLKRAGLKT